MDGTASCVQGYTVFCVSRGLERLAVEDRSSGKPGRRVAAVVYDPTRDEMFSAEQGRGAQLNGETIHVSKIAALKECLLATGFPSHKRHNTANIYFYHQITFDSPGVRPG